MQMVEKRSTKDIQQHSLSASAECNDRNQIASGRASLGKGEEIKHILVVIPEAGANGQIRTYSEHLSTLLYGQASCSSKQFWELEKQFNREAYDYDLVLIDLPQQTELQYMLFGFLKRRLEGRASAYLLVAQTPLWPIRQILLVLRLQSQETLAVDWAGRITYATGAKLTIQPIVSAQPVMNRPGNCLHMGIDSLLTYNTRGGEQLRYFLNQLNQWQVNGTLRLRQGDPLWQVRTEIEEGQYDLIITGTEESGRLRSPVPGEFVESLISMARQPILISGARQTVGQDRIQVQNEQGAQ